MEPINIKGIWKRCFTKDRIILNFTFVTMKVTIFLRNRKWENQIQERRSNHAVEAEKEAFVVNISLFHIFVT
jgi:hypothetical protein